MKRQRKGKIINISSGTVPGGTPMFLHYAITPGLTIADESQKKMLSSDSDFLTGQTINVVGGTWML